MRLSMVVPALAVLCLAVPDTRAQEQAGPPAIESMNRRDLQDELRAARPLVENGAVRASRPPGCTAAENRQLDFWLGEWDVSPSGQDFVIGESSIQSGAQGCAVLEHWRPFQGPHGHSISAYDASDGKWHQEYVGAGGRRRHMTGQISEGVLVLDIDTGSGPRQRMSYRQMDDGSVRQWGEVFNAGAWRPTFDLTYRRRPGSR